MTKIPEFNERGVLPDGIYPCDADAFEERFVAEFSTSEAREEHCDGFKKLRSEIIQKVLLPVTQWVDGSFVTNKENPGDIDVVTFVDYDRLNELSADKQELLLMLANSEERTKPEYSCHTFIVPSCGESHDYFSEFEKWRSYWRKWFGKTRDTKDQNGNVIEGHHKGFVSMTLGDADNAPRISSERRMP